MEMEERGGEVEGEWGVLEVCGELKNGYEQGSCILSLVVQPILCLIGLVLNLATIAIFALALKRGQRTTMLVYLMGLSMLDSGQLLLTVPIIYFKDLSEFYGAGNGAGQLPPALHEQLRTVSVYSTVYLYPILMAANYGSIWVVTLICIQRFFAICYPLSSLRTVELTKARRELVILGVLAVALNLIRYGEFKTEWAEMGENETSSVVLGFGPLFSGHNRIYLLVMDGFLYCFFLYFLPFTIVTILNARILVAIFRARKILPSMSQRHRKEHRSAFMILAIILLFFLCYTLAVAERFWTIVDQQTARSQIGYFLNSLSNCLVNANSALDPLMYAVFSRGFRDLFQKIRQQKSFHSNSSYRNPNSMSVNGKAIRPRFTAFSCITSSSLLVEKEWAMRVKEERQGPGLQGPSRKLSGESSGGESLECIRGFEPRPLLFYPSNSAQLLVTIQN